MCKFLSFFLIFLLDFIIVTINLIQLLAAILIRINYLSILQALSHLSLIHCRHAQHLCKRWGHVIWEKQRNQSEFPQIPSSHFSRLVITCFLENPISCISQHHKKLWQWRDKAVQRTQTPGFSFNFSLTFTHTFHYLCLRLYRLPMFWSKGWRGLALGEDS